MSFLPNAVIVRRIDRGWKGWERDRRPSLIQNSARTPEEEMHEMVRRGARTAGRGRIAQFGVYFLGVAPTGSMSIWALPLLEACPFEKKRRDDEP